MLVRNICLGTDAALEDMTRTRTRQICDRMAVNSVSLGPVEGNMYFAAGEKFWRQLEPFQQNTPLSAIRVNVDCAGLV